MQTSESIDLISAALVKAQSELEHAVKDSPNEAFKRGGKAMKYADLSAVWDAAKPVLKANDLAALQDTVNTDAGIGVRTRILHKSGQWIEFEPPIIPLTQKTAHGVGSATTYGRRYSLSAALGVVADEDDDGNAASLPANANGAQAPEPKKSIPGITKIKNDVTAAVRELNACGDGDQLKAYLPSISGLCLQVCRDVPDLWVGPEEDSGFRGMITKAADVLLMRPDVDKWLSKVEATARQPIAAE